MDRLASQTRPVQGIQSIAETPAIREVSGALDELLKRLEDVRERLGDSTEQLKLNFNLQDPPQAASAEAGAYASDSLPSKLQAIRHSITLLERIAADLRRIA